MTSLALLFLMQKTAVALLPIPTKLTVTDRTQALQLIGYGSSQKILDDPYPLGGYSGFEIGLSNEALQTDQFASMGSKAPTQSQVNYNTITIGKGIYNNVDTFLTFSLMGAENVTDVGAQIRWGFYQASYLPIYMSAVLHGNSFNCEDLIVTNSIGLDLIAGFKEGDVTLYFGGGPIRTQGVFSGGTGAITDTKQTVGMGLLDSRFLAGLNIRFGKYFLAGEIDSYSTAVYGAKIGYRF